MQPRMRVGGALKAQWAQSADHARDVRGEVIHPRSVHIGDQPVIDEAGRWVGESTGLRGPQGEPGAMGETGATGPAGISIASAAVVDGQLKLTLSNGMVVDAGSVSGPR